MCDTSRKAMPKRLKDIVQLIAMVSLAGQMVAFALAADQHATTASSDSPLLQLTRLELRRGVIANTIYENARAKVFFSEMGLALHYRRMPSEGESNNLVAVFRNTAEFLVKEVVPHNFWEDNLSHFYAQNLTNDEAYEIIQPYDQPEGSSAERKLPSLRAAFIEEIAPVLQEVVKTRIKSFKIPSGAMIPTLLIGDHIVVDKSAYLAEKPHRGDVIVFRYPEDETKLFIKRVIGLPRDTIHIKNKLVYINGLLLDDDTYTQRLDPGIIEGAINPRDNLGPVTVPPEAYFVMGDNRDQSLDSRFWGYVQKSQIIGRVWMIYWSWADDSPRWDRIGRRF